MKMHKIKAPAALLVTAVLAGHAVKPTLQSPRQIEIGAIDGEYERFVQDAGIEPIRQDQFESSGVAVHIGCLFPLIDPGETMPPPLRRLADRGHHGGRLQPVERSLETIVV